MCIIFVVVLYLDFCVRDLVKCAFKEGKFACREFFFQFHVMVVCDGEDVFADFCVDE